jgi:tetratricopeptide (TPR) repeat protein
VSEALELYKKGLGLFGQDKHLEAIAAYEQALAIQPDWTDALHALAMAKMKSGDLDEAIRISQRIVELDPEDAFAHTSMSIFYQRKGMIEEAEKEGA